jgi:hypothetical protein
VFCSHVHDQPSITFFARSYHINITGDAVCAHDVTRHTHPRSYDDGDTEWVPRVDGLSVRLMVDEEPADDINGGGGSGGGGDAMVDDDAPGETPSAAMHDTVVRRANSNSSSALAAAAALPAKATATTAAAVSHDTSHGSPGAANVRRQTVHA